MKKKIYVIIIFTFLFTIAIATKSFGYFEINDFEINCTVLENGDMKVEENITYKTNEYRNGVTRDIELKNQINTKNSANGFLLQSVKVDGKKYKETNLAQKGDSGVYEYAKNSNTHSLKVYTPFNRVGKTVTYTYILKDVAVKYQDTAEVFWNFIGNKWDTNINNVQINITLPYEATKGAIYVFGHGSDNGTFEKTGNYISLNAKNLEPYQALDARILFSNAAVPNSNKNVNKKVLEEYIDQEEGMTEKREERKLMLGLTVNKIALGLSVIIILAGIIIYIKYTKKDKIEKQKYIREIPANLEPELLQTIYYGKVCHDAFWITFLNLVKLGVYRIEKTVNEVGKESQKIIFIKEVEGLKEHQKKVMSIINSNMNGSIDLMQLKTRFKSNSGSGYGNFKTKLMLRKESLFGEEMKVPKKVKRCLYMAIAILVVLISVISSIVSGEQSIIIGVIMFLSITTLIYTIMFQNIKFNSFTILFMLVHCGAFQMANFAMLNSVGTGMLYMPYLLLFILIQIVSRIKIYSKEELQIKEQIKGLRRFIQDYSMLAEKGLEHITLWEDYLILAIALKLNNKTINYFYNYCKDNINTDFGQSLIHIGTYSVMSSSLGQTFNSYQKSYTSHVSSGSSYSGSSGGFSGGSSSGGGGRRRRRRKFLLRKTYPQL